jgi:hypothetical protein
VICGARRNEHCGNEGGHGGEAMATAILWSSIVGMKGVNNRWDVGRNGRLRCGLRREEAQPAGRTARDYQDGTDEAAQSAGSQSRR